MKTHSINKNKSLSIFSVIIVPRSVLIPKKIDWLCWKLMRLFGYYGADFGYFNTIDFMFSSLFGYAPANLLCLASSSLLRRLNYPSPLPRRCSSINLDPSSTWLKYCSAFHEFRFVSAAATSSIRLPVSNVVPLASS